MTQIEALKRVTVRTDPEQAEAAQIFIDPTGGGDRAHLTINPDLVDAQAQAGYMVKAGISAVLEAYRRYNRAITRKYGTYADEQHLFDIAVERAEFELEQLVHHGPPSISDDASPAEPAPAGEASSETGGEPDAGGDSPEPGGVEPQG
ncbi:hypothetical protein [Deinococcus sp. UYEF24]